MSASLHRGEAKAAMKAKNMAQREDEELLRDGINLHGDVTSLEAPGILRWGDVENARAPNKKNGGRYV